MDQLKRVAQLVSTVIAAFMAILALASWTNQQLLDHLDKTFATKADLAKVEQKIDALLQRPPR